MEMIDKKIYEDMYQAALNGINHIIKRLNEVNVDSNTDDVLLWLEKIGKAAQSLKNLEDIICESSQQMIIRGGAKLTESEMKRHIIN